MRLLMTVLEDRGYSLSPGEVVPVRNNSERALFVIEDLLGEDVTVNSVETALETHALDDYWVDLPAGVVAEHTLDNDIFQVARAGTGIISAAANMEAVDG